MLIGKLEDAEKISAGREWPLISISASHRRFRNIVFFFFVLRIIRRTFWKLKGRGIIGTIVELYTDARRILYGYFLRAPGIRTQVRKQVTESLAKVQAKMIPTSGSRYLALPKEGWD